MAAYSELNIPPQIRNKSANEVLRAAVHERRAAHLAAPRLRGSGRLGPAVRGSRAACRARLRAREDVHAGGCARAHPRRLSRTRSASRPKASARPPSSSIRTDARAEMPDVKPEVPVFDALHVPPAALDQGGVEVLRAVIVDGALHVSLRRAFDDPEAWGMLIADITRHVGRIYVRQVPRGRDRRAHPRDLRCRDGRADRSRHHQRAELKGHHADQHPDARALAHDGEGQSRQVAEEGRREGEARRRDRRDRDRQGHHGGRGGRRGHARENRGAGRHRRRAGEPVDRRAGRRGRGCEGRGCGGECRSCAEAC